MRPLSSQLCLLLCPVSAQSLNLYCLENPGSPPVGFPGSCTTCSDPPAAHHQRDLSQMHICPVTFLLKMPKLLPLRLVLEFLRNIALRSHLGALLEYSFLGPPLAQRLRGAQEPSALPIHPHQASRPLPTLGTQANRGKYTHSRRPAVTQAGCAQLPSLTALCPPRSLSTSCEEPLAVPKCASAIYASSPLRRLCALPQMLCSCPHVPDAGLQAPWSWGLVLFHPCASRAYHVTWHVMPVSVVD